MKALKRWTAAVLTLALAASLSISAALAAEPFADFRIDAAQMDVPDRSIQIGTYQRGEDGTFQWSQGRSYDCKINRVTGDATFYIQPNEEGVWVTIDYLTNVLGDGFYELLEDNSSPVWDSLSVTGDLIQGGNEALAPGQTYILSAETLVSRFHAAARARAGELSGASPDAYILNGFPLCQVTLRCTDPADGQEYTQVYYLEIFEDILLPNDVLPSESWYDAVAYCLGKGWLTGRLGDGVFSPNDPLTRAELAQVLWTVGGCQEAEQTGFTDVDADDWFCQAVSWCRQEGLIAGYADGSFLPDAPLTREQLASFLHRYAKFSGSSTYSSGDLSRYSDHTAVSAWAYDSLCWAVSGRLLTVADGALRPGDTVTRAELAQALYAYRTALTPLSMW